MHFGTGAIVFVAFVALYLVVLWFERQSRSGQSINRHPYRNPYDSARGASREGPADQLESRSATKYARGTR
jgi:hypothetical protein